MSEHNPSLEAIQDIRRMMKRSSRFISLSGLSGIAAGFWALAGSFFAYDWINEYNSTNQSSNNTGSSFQLLKYNLLSLAIVVLVAALVSAFYFTWLKAKRNNMPIWDHTSKNLLINMLIPLIAGGLLILSMLRYDEWRFIAPISLIFYGLSLVSGSKFTVDDIRYLGYCQIILGLINTQFIGYGLYFWAFGFGVLHIVYGFIMWYKYERKQKELLS